MNTNATNLDPTYAFERDLMLMEHLDRTGLRDSRSGVVDDGRAIRGYALRAPWGLGPVIAPES